MTEIEGAKRNNMWTHKPRREALGRGWKVVKARWIDINTRNSETSIMRIRVVGKWFNTGDAVRSFADTTIESIKIIVE